MAQSQKPTVSSLDHLVLTVAHIETTCTFYQTILGMTAHVFDATDGTQRRALSFGTQKINLHETGKEFDPKANTPTPGSADLCFLTQTSLGDWQAHFAKYDINIENGPIERSGASGPILSLYIRDPDGNLIEVSTQM